MIGGETRFRGVRYQVTDVDRPVAFYTELLGFALGMQQGQALQPVAGIASFFASTISRRAWRS